MPKLPLPPVVEEAAHFRPPGLVIILTFEGLKSMESFSRLCRRTVRGLENGLHSPLKARGELRMPLGERIAHMAPEGCRGIRDLGGELLVGAGDGFPKVVAGDIRAPASLACVGDVTEDAGELP